MSLLRLLCSPPPLASSARFLCSLSLHTTSARLPGSLAVITLSSSARLDSNMSLDSNISRRSCGRSYAPWLLHASHAASPAARRFARCLASSSHRSRHTCLARFARLSLLPRLQLASLAAIPAARIARRASPAAGFARRLTCWCCPPASPALLTAPSTFGIGRDSNRLQVNFAGEN